MNPTIVVEVIFSLITIVGFLFLIEPSYTFNVKTYIFEDLYASLTSLNYQNFVLQDICSITASILPGNYKFQVIVNGSLICGSNYSEKLYEIEDILVKNGTIYNISIVIGK